MLKILLVILVILGLVTTGAYLYKNTDIQNTSKRTDDSNPLGFTFPLDESEIKKIPDLRPYKRYTSSKLGISFFYPEYEGVAVIIHEEDNRICLGDDSEVCEGLDVYVYSKTADESLEQAIKREFLSDPQYSECYVVTQSMEKWDWEETYQQADIRTNRPEEESIGPRVENHCPGSNSHFVMDTNYADKLLRFPNHQYAITLDQTFRYSWSDSINFEK